MRYRLTLKETGDSETFIECWDEDWMHVLVSNGREPEVESITLLDAKKMAIEAGKSDALFSFLEGEKPDDEDDEDDELDNLNETCLPGNHQLMRAWQATIGLYEFQKKTLVAWLMLDGLTEESAIDAMDMYRELLEEKV